MKYKPNRKPKKWLPQTLDSINQAEGDDVSHANTVDLERLICRKAGKAKRKMKEDFVKFMKKKMKVLGIT